MAHAAEIAREAEVEADALGVAVVQVAVRLGREPPANLRPVAARGVFAGGKVVLDDAANEIGGGSLAFRVRPTLAAGDIIGRLDKRRFYFYLYTSYR